MKRNKIPIIILLVMIIAQQTFYSCSGNTNKDYYENGNIKRVYQLDSNGNFNGKLELYDESGRLKELHHYKNGALIDSSIFYNPEKEIKKVIYYETDFKYVKNYRDNKNLKSEGNLNNNELPFGKWKYYNSYGQLDRIKEYEIIKGETYLNQDWFFNGEGDTISNKGSYYSIDFEKDTINLNEPVKAILTLNQPLFKNKNSSVKVIIPKDYSDNFNSDFSNEMDVNSDTIYDLNIEIEHRQVLGLKADFRRNVIFGRYYNTPGLKKLRGIIIEYYQDKSSILSKDTLKYFENKKYFEKEIFVNDKEQEGN